MFFSLNWHFCLFDSGVEKVFDWFKENRASLPQSSAQSGASESHTTSSTAAATESKNHKVTSLEKEIRMLQVSHQGWIFDDDIK